MLSNFLKNASRKIGNGDEKIFVFSVERQKKYISKFKEPKSNVERAYFQYKSQMKVKGFWASLIMNLASIIFIPVYLLKPNTKRTAEADSCDAVFVRDGHGESILPSSLKKEFKKIEKNPIEGNLLSSADRKYISKIFWKHPFSYQFVLKAIIKIMRYRWIIDMYQPKALIVCNEFSFTSSLLTDYCNKDGVELINVMHGEKLYYIRDSFFKFNRCYIWDEHYKNLFTELRADPDQFIIEAPPSIKFESSPEKKTVDYTYYLQTHSPEEFRRITDALKQLALQGNKVAIRPHPRFTNLDELNKYIGDSDIEVEKNSEISIEKSVLRTNNVVSKYSTVLFQAYSNGTTAVIDDISNPEFYKKLDELKFAMLNLEHKLLSEIV